VYTAASQNSYLFHFNHFVYVQLLVFKLKIYPEKVLTQSCQSVYTVRMSLSSEALKYSVNSSISNNESDYPTADTHAFTSEEIQSP